MIGVWPIELRNRNWLTDAHRGTTLQFFRSRRLALVLVDAPQSEHFTVMQTENQITNPKLAYLRLHGRNARAYISGRSVAERFNYDYSDQEIDEVADRVRELAEDTEDVHVAFNNNHSLYAPKAALRLKDRSGTCLSANRASLAAVPEVTPVRGGYEVWRTRFGNELRGS